MRLLRLIFVFLLSAVFITSLVCRTVYAQQASNNKRPSTSKDPNKPDASAENKAADSQTPPPPQDWRNRDRLTGDWGGARTKMEEHGFTFELEFTQFYQGIASGGLEEDDAYGGRVDAKFKFELGKLGLWKNGTIDAKTATRYGTSVNTLTGALLPANVPLIVPADRGTVTAVTTLKYTHIFPFEKPCDMFLVSGQSSGSFSRPSRSFRRVRRRPASVSIRRSRRHGRMRKLWRRPPEVAVNHVAREEAVVCLGTTASFNCRSNVWTTWTTSSI